MNNDFGYFGMNQYGGQNGEQSMFSVPLANTAPTQTGTSWLGDLFKNVNAQYDTKTGAKTGDGWGGAALGTAQGLFNAYMGMKQYGLFKDQFDESKRQFQLNYDAQKTTTNSALEDRQRARVASNSGAYQSVGDYMQQNGIKG